MNRLFVRIATLVCFCVLTPLASVAEVSEMQGFNQRMKAMEDAVSKQVGNRLAQIKAYNALERALNVEMERAFDRTMTLMKPAQRAKMTESQHLWLQHRDNEYRWMDRAHGPVTPNSDAHLQVLQLRNLLMNARVIQLYSYLSTLPTSTKPKLASTGLVPKTNTVSGKNELKIATLLGFSLGDGACFLDLRDEKRKHFTEVAKPAFCQRERELLDKKVSLSYKLGVVSGATCAVESIDCGENNMLVLVSDAKVIRHKRPAN